MAFRATRVLLGYRLPDYNAPSQVILRTVKENGPLTVAQIWEKLANDASFKSKNHMKNVLDALRRQKRLIPKPADRTVKQSIHQYHLGDKPIIVDADGNLLRAEMTMGASVTGVNSQATETQ
eukprot:760781-Hanusia_phi.AAC.6